MPIKLTRKHKRELQKLGVSTLYLFGSRAQGMEGMLSDYDFAVLMHNPSVVKPGRDTLSTYYALYDILFELTDGKGEPTVDIVFLQSGVSLELQANVVRNGRLLFDDDPRSRAEYEAQVMVRAADFKPVLNLIDQVILERI